jgi:hypothetical protein
VEIDAGEVQTELYNEIRLAIEVMNAATIEVAT